MTTPFHLPDLGEGLEEAEIIAWHVEVGDHIVADQLLVTVETDKAVVDVPSPQSGDIVALHGAVGDIVPTHALLVEFGSVDRHDAGAIVGELPTPRSGPAASTPPAPQTAVRAVPAVRFLARDLGVDIDDIRGTGPNGLATASDIRDAARLADARAGATPVRGVRRAMARTMSRSHAEVVPATVMDEADIGAWSETEDPTVRLMQAVAHACSVVPILNATQLGVDRGLRPNDQVDVAVAVETDDGLFAPVLRDVGGVEGSEIRLRLDELTRQVTDRTIAPDQLRGATITLSNFGMHAGRHAVLVVVPPQVAIVGGGRIGKVPVVSDDAVTVGRVLPLSLTFDHRFVTGVEAAGFLASMIQHLTSRTPPT